MRRVLIGIAGTWAFGLATAVVAVATAAAAATCGAGFSNNGANQCVATIAASATVKTLSVPAGIRYMNMTVSGGQGGMSLDQGTGSGAPGGKGGRQYATVPVTPGDTLQIVVGQGGGVADLIHPPTPPFGGGGVPGGGYSGYGGGGSFVFAASSGVLIAAGGGGGGGYDYNPEASGQAVPQAAPGGAGAGASAAGDGKSVKFCCDPTWNAPPHVPPGGGYGATPTGPGAGGVPVGSNLGFAPSTGNPGQGPATSPTNLGVGGDGPASPGTSGCFSSWAGGGGGGYYGGGSGGSISCDLEGGGGGGGAGYVVPTATGAVSSVGVQGGAGQVTISYTMVAASPPSAPTAVTASAGSGPVTVWWTAPASTGGAAITKYVVTPYLGGVAQAPITYASAATSQIVTGLTVGSTYTFTVAAVNVAGTGVASAMSGPVTVPSLASAPGKPKAVAGDASAKLTWTAPASNGGNPITGYLVTPYLGTVAQPPQSFVSTALTQTVTGLTNGASYTFAVAATTSAGTGLPSAKSTAIAIGVPGAPTKVVATAGVGQALLTWVAPVAVNGSPITGYVVTPYIGAAAQPKITFASTVTSQTVTGLASATIYTFKVTAVNARGSGLVSAKSNAVTIG